MKCLLKTKFLLSIFCFLKFCLLPLNVWLVPPFPMAVLEAAMGSCTRGWWQIKRRWRKLTHHVACGHWTGHLKEHMVGEMKTQIKYQSICYEHCSTANTGSFKIACLANNNHFTRWKYQSICNWSLRFNWTKKDTIWNEKQIYIYIHH